jgi:hypothetical protein
MLQLHIISHSISQRRQGGKLRTYQNCCRIVAFFEKKQTLPQALDQLNGHLKTILGV